MLRLVMEVILFVCWFCKYCDVESSVLYVDSGVKKSVDFLEILCENLMDGCWSLRFEMKSSNCCLLFSSVYCLHYIFSRYLTVLLSIN